jgi:RimJ/RimL family protein N-acetyltransferase
MGAELLIGRTDRLVLEPLSHLHADGLVAALGNPSVSSYLNAPDVTTVEALHARIDRLQRGAPDGEVWINFAIRRVDDGAIVGRVEATRYGAWAEIAYLVGPAYQRRGYATEASRWLLSQLAASGVHEVWAAVHPDNVASCMLLARCGFERRAGTPRSLASYDAGDALFVRMAGR